MRREGEGVGVNRFSFPPILKASVRVCGVKEGMEIHGVAEKMGFDSDPYVQTWLMGVYIACGCVFEARLVFDKILHRDVVTWCYDRWNLHVTLLVTPTPLFSLPLSNFLSSTLFSPHGHTEGNQFTRTYGEF
ncbi:hypothetical protein IFM89_008892 [Coptis chinensis]|uniref:Pentatricopeptide repeat-containing protein n=1 Tax=Coptis chinensis TaxID=261450 RepID=A0A835HTR7_9MAGN|nr:hypothetical protein IFM89_008892 [Coptis chinensis]